MIRKWKRVLALALCVATMTAMLGISAGAEDVEPEMEADPTSDVADVETAAESAESENVTADVTEEEWTEETSEETVTAESTQTDVQDEGIVAEVGPASDGVDYDVVESVLGITEEDIAAVDPEKPYLVLGADLSDSQLSTVLDLLGVENKETYLEDYNVYYTTNAEEYEYFGDYLSSSVIGTKAYSSILVTPREEGEGISITTKNISYCTVSMYQNALITAGVSDVEMVVAGPTNISGTAALVSAMKVYELMTGEALSEESIDAASNELVLTGEIDEEIGDDADAAELIAAVKSEVFADGTDVTEDEIAEALDRICEEMGVTLSDETRQKVIDLIMKISETDFDVEALEEQATELWNKVQEILKDAENGNTDGFFARIWHAIVDFFRNLFNL